MNKSSGLDTQTCIHSAGEFQLKVSSNFRKLMFHHFAFVEDLYWFLFSLTGKKIKKATVAFHSCWSQDGGSMHPKRRETLLSSHVLPQDHA